MLAKGKYVENSYFAYSSEVKYFFLLASFQNNGNNYSKM